MGPFYALISTCRRIDPKGLPHPLDVGGRIELPVHLLESKTFEASRMKFDVSTDQGGFAVLTSLVALPDHTVHPSTFVNTELSEEDDWTFEFVHREILTAGSAQVHTDIEGSPKLRIEMLGHQSGSVANYPDLSYRDTFYRAHLNDSEIGTKRETMLLKSEGLIKPAMEIPVIWRPTAVSLVNTGSSHSRSQTCPGRETGTRLVFQSRPHRVSRRRTSRVPVSVSPVMKVMVY